MLLLRAQVSKGSEFLQASKNEVQPNTKRRLYLYLSPPGEVVTNFPAIYPSYRCVPEAMGPAMPPVLTKTGERLTRGKIYSTGSPPFRKSLLPLLRGETTWSIAMSKVGPCVTSPVLPRIPFFGLLFPTEWLHTVHRGNIILER